MVQLNCALPRHLPIGRAMRKAKHVWHILVTAGLVLMAALVSGCAAPKVEKTDPPASSLGPRKLAVFFDGTSNHVAQGTNTSELFVLAKEQRDIGTFYVEGVGAKGKPIGLAMAWGIGERVRLAYAYLAEHYRPGDDIYIFGFSRGAYSGRILASMLYHAGLPGQPLSSITAEELANLVFDAYKCPMLQSDEVCSNPGEWSSAKRIENVNTALSRYQLPRVVPAPVRFMGLWDTVEALGWPDYKEDVDVPNPRYADQLCNVKRAAHAVSLDDNRARIFTPILLTRRHLLSDCALTEMSDLKGKELDAAIDMRINEIVDEVWFPGAHADVGGGYEGEQGGLSGVSLNWMITMADREGLKLRPSADGPLPRPQDHLADGNDPQGSFPWFLFYKRMYRNIDAYADHANSTSNTLKFHRSLESRLATKALNKAEYGGPDEDYLELLRQVPNSRFESCFPINKEQLRVFDKSRCAGRIVFHP